METKSRMWRIEQNISLLGPSFAKCMDWIFIFIIHLGSNYQRINRKISTNTEPEINYF